MAASYCAASGELGYKSHASSLLQTQNLELAQLRDQCAQLHKESQELQNQNAELRGELKGLKQVLFSSHSHANVIDNINRSMHKNLVDKLADRIDCTRADIKKLVTAEAGPTSSILQEEDFKSIQHWMPDKYVAM